MFAIQVIQVIHNPEEKARQCRSPGQRFFFVFQGIFTTVNPAGRAHRWVTNPCLTRWAIGKMRNSVKLLARLSRRQMRGQRTSAPHPMPCFLPGPAKVPRFRQSHCIHGYRFGNIACGSSIRGRQAWRARQTRAFSRIHAQDSADASTVLLGSVHHYRHVAHHLFYLCKLKA